MFPQDQHLSLIPEKILTQPLMHGAIGSPKLNFDANSRETTTKDPYYKCQNGGEMTRKSMQHSRGDEDYARARFENGQGVMGGQ